MCCYFWFHSEVKFLTCFDVLYWTDTSFYAYFCGASEATIATHLPIVSHCNDVVIICGKLWLLKQPNMDIFCASFP